MLSTEGGKLILAARAPLLAFTGGVSLTNFATADQVAFKEFVFLVGGMLKGKVTSAVMSGAEEWRGSILSGKRTAA